MVTLRTRLNERLATPTSLQNILNQLYMPGDKDIKHANERLVAALLEVEFLQYRFVMQLVAGRAKPNLVNLFLLG